MGVCLGIYFIVFTLTHAFGFDSVRSKLNAPIFIYNFSLFIIGFREGRLRQVHQLREHRPRPGGASPRHHDQRGARWVQEREADVRSHRLSRARGLRQEHDLWRVADGRRDPSRRSQRGGDAADQGASLTCQAGRGEKGALEFLPL
jgi:hypothetical protein